MASDDDGINLDSLHLIPLNFPLDDLDSLSSAQLACVQFHLKATALIKSEAKVLFSMRRAAAFEDLARTTSAPPRSVLPTPTPAPASPVTATRQPVPVQQAPSTSFTEAKVEEVSESLPAQRVQPFSRPQTPKPIVPPSQPPTALAQPNPPLAVPITPQTAPMIQSSSPMDISITPMPGDRKDGVGLGFTFEGQAEVASDRDSRATDTVGTGSRTEGEDLYPGGRSPPPAVPHRLPTPESRQEYAASQSLLQGDRHDPPLAGSSTSASDPKKSKAIDQPPAPRTVASGHSEGGYDQERSWDGGSRYTDERPVRDQSRSRPPSRNRSPERRARSRSLSPRASREECRYHPHCKRGEACRYRHPSSKYDDRRVQGSYSDNRGDRSPPRRERPRTPERLRYERQEPYRNSSTYRPLEDPHRSRPRSRSPVGYDSRSGVASRDTRRDNRALDDRYGYGRPRSRSRSRSPPPHLPPAGRGRTAKAPSREDQPSANPIRRGRAGDEDGNTPPRPNASRAGVAGGRAYDDVRSTTPPRASSPPRPMRAENQVRSDVIDEAKSLPDTIPSAASFTLDDLTALPLDQVETLSNGRTPAPAPNQNLSAQPHGLTSRPSSSIQEGDARPRTSVPSIAPSSSSDGANTPPRSEMPVKAVPNLPVGPSTASNTLLTRMTLPPLIDPDSSRPSAPTGPRARHPIPAKPTAETFIRSHDPFPPSSLVSKKPPTVPPTHPKGGRATPPQPAQAGIRAEAAKAPTQPSAAAAKAVTPNQVAPVNPIQPPAAQVQPARQPTTAPAQGNQAKPGPSPAVQANPSAKAPTALPTSLSSVQGAVPAENGGTTSASASASNQGRPPNGFSRAPGVKGPLSSQVQPQGGQASLDLQQRSLSTVSSQDPQQASAPAPPPTAPRAHVTNRSGSQTTEATKTLHASVSTVNTGTGPGPASNAAPNMPPRNATPKPSEVIPQSVRDTMFVLHIHSLPEVTIEYFAKFLEEPEIPECLGAHISDIGGRRHGWAVYKSAEDADKAVAFCRDKEMNGKGLPCGRPKSIPHLLKLTWGDLNQKGLEHFWSHHPPTTQEPTAKATSPLVQESASVSAGGNVSATSGGVARVEDRCQNNPLPPTSAANHPNTSSARATTGTTAARHEPSSTHESAEIVEKSDWYSYRKHDTPPMPFSIPPTFTSPAPSRPAVRRIPTVKAEDSPSLTDLGASSDRTGDLLGRLNPTEPANLTSADTAEPSGGHLLGRLSPSLQTPESRQQLKAKLQAKLQKEKTSKTASSGSLRGETEDSRGEQAPGLSLAERMGGGATGGGPGRGSDRSPRSETSRGGYGAHSEQDFIPLDSESPTTSPGPTPAHGSLVSRMGTVEHTSSLLDRMGGGSSSGDSSGYNRSKRDRGEDGGIFGRVDFELLGDGTNKRPRY